MLATLLRKKVNEDQVANYFVNTLIDMVDAGFPEVADIINNDPEFVSPPSINPENSDRFLMIVVTGNLCILSNFLRNTKSKEGYIIDLIIQKLSRTFDVTPQVLTKNIREFQSYFNRINYPSKNTRYAMSKAIFFQYKLNDFQSDYFRNLNSPNPIFLKRLDEIVDNYIINWESFSEKFRIAL